MGNMKNANGAIIAKYSAFEGKRYLRMLVTTGKCPLTWSERRVLSYKVYKARDGKPLQYSKIARVLGMDRHTVSRAVKRLEEKGVYADNPVSVEPEWFARPYRDGTPRCYRHYFVDRGLTELENTLYWMLWSLTSTGAVTQTKSGLAALTHYSRYRVSVAIKKLADKELIRVERRRITLLDPPTLDYWQDRQQKVAKPVVEAAPGPVLSEDWVAVLVDFYYEAAASRNDRENLVIMIQKQVTMMKIAAIGIADICEYWQATLRLIPDAEKAWNFACIKFADLLKEALRVHAAKGRAKTCIGLLTHLTTQLLSQPSALLW
jgi:DNA-binding MarR family transcriptional regulator